MSVYWQCVHSLQRQYNEWVRLAVFTHVCGQRFKKLVPISSDIQIIEDKYVILTIETFFQGSEEVVPVVTDRGEYIGIGHGKDLR